MNTTSEKGISAVQPPEVDRLLMRRAVYLATRADVRTSPNPRVGCVIAAGATVVAEGLFRRDGGPHAEIDALSRLPSAETLPRRGLTAYVSLEPCSIHGRTPPCADRLVAEGFGRVVVGALDHTPGVCGEGLRRLRLGGIPVRFGVGQDLAHALAAPRNVFATRGRPYTVLKQAVTADGFVGRRGQRVAITGSVANVVSHQWRSEADAILVGAGTVLADAPSLTTRHVAGRSPRVVVLDARGGLSPKQVATSFPPSPDREVDHLVGEAAAVPAVLAYLAERRIGRLLVEGGPRTLVAFARAGAWDEYREWRSPRELPPGGGEAIPAAEIGGRRVSSQQVGADTLVRYRPAGPGCNGALNVD